ncbi:ABC-ATPase domain-containing protein [Thermotalea metallivorans]|uniref:ATPase of the ABC class n=1 Tax=Thermotalea metallivorans TaxID=520762 RepID=A0A140L7C2_9FIRM|nr:ABC-ATPase domain-containing protein [Thermotalea metallivorans]KXG76447.1 hypothetical protein AN619_09780 [Thermotalea metallivorans]
MEQLKAKLHQIDGKGYKAYKSIQGTYHGHGYLLHIDYVQPDPFANPSRVRFEMPKAVAKYKDEWYQTPWRRTAFEDFIAREVARRIKLLSDGIKGSGKSGLVLIDAPGQEVLKRTAVKADQKSIEIRLSVGFPAEGRKILGKEAIQLLYHDIPYFMEQAILHLNPEQLMEHLILADQQEAIRRYLTQNNYICFIANGSVLPRESGISNRPLRGSQAIPFQSPPSLEIEIPIPHSQPIRGMAIPQGITLIVGGGYHGKSTLLKAIERGIYNHIRGDGREYVITDVTAFKIRAEDGRRVEKVNISPFISQLPFNKNTEIFSTDNASGSTSQAANIMEALEIGSKVLLMDEDTSATNFMIRDGRMQALVEKEKEPITPFIDKVRLLYSDYRVSTILVIGGSGDYFDVADRVIMMDTYRPFDVTEKAKAIARQWKSGRLPEGGKNFGQVAKRVIQKKSMNPFKGKKEKIDVKGLHTILYGSSAIDLSFVEQLVDPSQTRAIAHMMGYLSKCKEYDSSTLSDMLEGLYQLIEAKGLEAISPYFGQHPGDLALPRQLEAAAAINRLRTLQVR